MLTPSSRAVVVARPVSRDPGGAIGGALLGEEAPGVQGDGFGGPP